jgi:hypothetical protein
VCMGCLSVCMYTQGAEARSDACLSPWVVRVCSVSAVFVCVGGVWVVCVCVCVCVCVWTRRILEYDPDYSKHELKHRQYLERFLPLFQTLNLDPKPKTQNPKPRTRNRHESSNADSTWFRV